MPPLRSNVICRPAEIPGDGSAIPQACENLGRESGGVDVDELAPHFGLAHQYLLLDPLDAETAGMVGLDFGQPFIGLQRGRAPRHHEQSISCGPEVTGSGVILPIRYASRGTS
jgi:hypothetical protein